jgi:hypothetical protein
MSAAEQACICLPEQNDKLPYTTHLIFESLQDRNTQSIPLWASHTKND